MLGGPISLATFRSQYGSLVPSLQASRLPKGAGSRRGAQQTVGTSDKVRIEQGESVGLPDFDFNVVSVFDVEGCACDLFVRGPGNQQHPVEASSCGEEWSGDKVGVFPLA